MDPTGLHGLPWRGDRRPGPQSDIRHELSEGEEDRAGAGQSEHPQARITLRSLSRCEARRLVERFEWHYTPKHGSCLDMAESELSVLSCQCLDRRIADKPALIEEVAAWEESRNKKHVKADWQFTTADARVKLKRLYPAL
jgi:uncharacterized small protein (DUF1192 family)